ncbi:HigA family addiction module antitoxin [Azospirillum thiophilum]|uniref:HigA family addiction module antitoxin n=1 Tax=Azospirillum thiophilum TaxID=528244 RepID=UPI0009E50AC7|nr:HigA family addiction module antitoxin [Azospirillum thiophilum]
MAIRIEDVEAGLIDLGDVTDPAGEPVGPVHPGDILKHDFLDPLGLSVYALANALGVARTRLNDIVLGRRAVTAETALRLARYFGTSPGFWMTLQAQYELEVAKRDLGTRVESEVHPRAA